MAPIADCIVSRPVKLSLHLREHQFKRRQRHREMVQRLIQHPRPILSRSKAHFILLQNSGSQRPHLHQGHVLANTIAWSDQERLEAHFALDHLRSTVPTFWDEVVGALVQILIYLMSAWHRHGMRTYVPRPTTYGGMVYVVPPGMNVSPTRRPSRGVMRYIPEGPG